MSIAVHNAMEAVIIVLHTCCLLAVHDDSQ